MSLKALVLDWIQLISSGNDVIHNLRLSGTPTVSIRLASGRLASLNQADFLKALTSAKVWVSRGNPFRLEVRVLFNGASLDGARGTQLLESLGYYLRDAPLWSQLSFSSSLELPQNKPYDSPDITISLTRSTARRDNDRLPYGWLLDNVDAAPPDSVHCVAFERLHIQLDFCTEVGPEKPPAGSVRPLDIMLLDIPVFDQSACLVTDEISETEEMLLSSLDETTNLARDEEAMLLHQSDEDSMLLSQTSISIPSLTRASTNESDNSSQSPSQYLQENYPTNTTIQTLVSTALHILISGSPPRNPVPALSVTIKSPLPSTTLAGLLPSIFSPGYTELVAHDAKFLPTISNAISSSWVRNVQGPRLQQKLNALSKSNVSMFMDRKESGAVENFNDVVKERVWGMMQRKLFDQGVAKKLKWDPEVEKTEHRGLDVGEDLLRCGNFEEDPDLLGGEFMDDDEILLFRDFKGIDDDGLQDEEWCFGDRGDQLLHGENDSMLL